MADQSRLRAIAKKMSWIMWSLVWDASIRQDAIPCRSASPIRRPRTSSSTSASPSTNFTALPPRQMKSRKYSRSIRSNQAWAPTPDSCCRLETDSAPGSALGVSAVMAISRSRNEPNPVIDPLGALFVVDDQRFDALCGGPAREFETFCSFRTEIRTPVQKQEIAREFLLRIVGTGQQRKDIVNVDQRDHPARIGPVPIAPNKPPIGAPDELEKRRLAESLRRFLRLRQKPNEL